MFYNSVTYAWCVRFAGYVRFARYVSCARYVSVAGYVSFAGYVRFAVYLRFDVYLNFASFVSFTRFIVFSNVNGSATARWFFYTDRLHRGMSIRKNKFLEFYFFSKIFRNFEINMKYGQNILILHALQVTH